MEPPIYEVFLVLHPVSSRLAELTHALEPVVEGDPPAADLDVYVRAGADTALVAVRFDERAMTGDAVRRLDDVARGAGLALVDPARLPADERRAFFEVRLPLFVACARGLARAADVAVVLADRAAPARPPSGRLGSPGTPGVREPRLVVHVPPLAAPDGSLAPRPAATPPPLPPRVSSPRAAGRAASPPPRPPTLPPPPGATPALGYPVGKRGRRTRTVTDRLAMSLVEQARQARVEAAEDERFPRPPSVPTDVDDVADPGAALDPPYPVAPAGVHQSDTAPLRRPGSDPGTPTPLRPVSEPGTPAPRAGSEPTLDTPPTLDVRFLRGSDWVPVRARALSARGAYIVHGAPARLGDTVHVSIACAGRTALVRGTVYHVTTAEDALSTGASGFAVRFPEYACPARTQLVQVLLAARHAGITLRPPPSRTAVRFPVRWPVRASGPGGPFRGEAQDVSAGGLFLATSTVLELGTELRFALPLDLADDPIEGTGRVARVLTAHDAAARGMREGLGVTIVAMDEVDRARWDAFVSRVRRRTEKRVLVGAAPGRVEELAATLNAAGYTVTAGSDLGLLMRVAELDPCPPDLAVIDAALDHGASPAGWIEQVFAARQVQCVTIHGDVHRARSTVDRLLHVAS